MNTFKIFEENIKLAKHFQKFDLNELIHNHRSAINIRDVFRNH